ncbi:MAG: hypothetical protein AAGF23_18155 [Acidobacteriota bacterium]
METLAIFNSLALETPQSIVIDRQGNRYISFLFNGEIRKITPEGDQSTLAVLPIGTPGVPCSPASPLPGLISGLALGPFGNLYANVAACDAADRGVYRVYRHDGSFERIAPLGLDVLPNGLERVGIWLYIADSLGSILRVPLWGGEPELFSDDPLLQEDPAVFGPGPNGVQFFRGELYVSNSESAQILAFRLRWDGSAAGPPRVHAQLPFGCDDFAFDIRGTIFCTTDPFNTVLEISPDGQTVETFLQQSDGLDNPTAAAFGRRGADRFNLYIINGASPLFSVTNTPSLIRVEQSVPGTGR